jgi:hypothetical protein
VRLLKGRLRRDARRKDLEEVSKDMRIRRRGRALPTPPIGQGTHACVARLSKSSIAFLLFGEVVGKIGLAWDVRD